MRGEALNGVSLRGDGPGSKGVSGKTRGASPDLTLSPRIASNRGEAPVRCTRARPLGSTSAPAPPCSRDLVAPLALERDIA